LFFRESDGQEHLLGSWCKTWSTKVPSFCPQPSSTSEDRLTILEEALNDVRQTVGSMSREIASIKRVMEIRGREISDFAKVREVDELHRAI